MFFSRTLKKSKLKLVDMKQLNQLTNTCVNSTVEALEHCVNPVQT